MARTPAWYFAVLTDVIVAGAQLTKMSPDSAISTSSAKLDECEGRLGYHFRDRAILVRALTHTSFVNESPEPKPESNERLEFLGDAVLEIIIAEWLYRERPELDEGDLTRMRAAIVRLETLGRLGLAMALGDYLQLGHGEEVSGGRARATIVGRALEAVIGAIYLDSGLELARASAMHIIDSEIGRLTDHQALMDDKSRLQESAQADLGQAPSYRTVAAVGPDHEKTFTVEVSIGDVTVGSGSGRTKQIAAQSAAHDALTRWPPDTRSSRS